MNRALRQAGLLIILVSPLVAVGLLMLAVDISPHHYHHIMSSPYGNPLAGLVEGIKGLFIICCIAVPLAIWKLIDIIVWICHHVSISASAHLH